MKAPKAKKQQPKRAVYQEKRAVLVYQAGIANVFRVKTFNQEDIERDAYRIAQGDYRTCEAYATGLAYAGFQVVTMACNQAGDITHADWSTDLYAQPFSHEFRPVWTGPY